MTNTGRSPAGEGEEDAASDYMIKPLAPDTWDAFARLVGRHNGVFGGCWCTWFHTFSSEKTHTVEGNRALKQQLVGEGRAHAAVVTRSTGARGCQPSRCRAPWT